MTDFAKHASELWDARKSGHVCPFPTQTLSVAEAYELQRAAIDASRQKVFGYKIGATADETLALLNLSEPFHGPIFEAHTAFTETDVTLALPLTAAHTPRIEAEFIVCFKHDVKRDNHQDVTLEQLSEHIDWIAPGFEFVGSRYSVPQGSPGTSVIGDFGAHQHSVIGTPQKDWQSLDLTAHAVALSINGEPAAQGHSGLSIYGNPLLLVCWLLNQPLMASGLKAGQIVSCGTCTGAIPVTAGNLVEADYGSLGSLNVRVQMV